MGLATMGKVLVAAKIENLFDVENREGGLLPAADVRSVQVTDALVDTGATGLLMPKRLIAQLGLRPYRTRPSRTIAGSLPLTMYTAVRLTIQGRDCLSDVAEIPDEFSVVIGQVPLELLDFIVDPKRQQLIGNPEHGGEHMIEA
jgi:predicted aspartyl protease